jgi:hypothetical protein
MDEFYRKLPVFIQRPLAVNPACALIFNFQNQEIFFRAACAKRKKYRPENNQGG